MARKHSQADTISGCCPRDIEAQHAPTKETKRISSSSPTTSSEFPDIKDSFPNSLTDPRVSVSNLTETTPEAVKQNEEPRQNGLCLKQRVWWRPVQKPAVQMIIAAMLAVVIGVAVAATDRHVPDSVRAVLGIPGDVWLRALKCVIVPLIITSLILAVQRLKQMSGHGARIAKWTLGYYLGFMMIAIVTSTAAAALGWSRLFVKVGTVDADGNELAQNSTAAQNVTAAGVGANATKLVPHEVVVQVFESLIPENIVEAIAADQRLLSVMVIALAVGYLLKPTSIFVKVVTEVEELVAQAVNFLIRVAPIGVFFLILPNLFVLPIREIGRNLGVLIGASLAGMFVHLFIIVSLFYLLVVRENPWAFWLRLAPAWMEAWGSGSSAATLPVVMECVLEQKVPLLVTKFVVPLGVLINMDGTALYFPVAVTFMAATQGITMNTGEYIIVALLSTLSTIGASPIPGSALVFVVMICGAVHVPVTSMYAVVVAIDWFIDRFRTALNASGDAFAAKVVAKVTGVHDGMDNEASDYGEKMYERLVEHNVDGTHRRSLRRIGSTLTV